MDVAKFNHELAKRVSKAQSFEKSNNIKDAIDSWVSIADLVLSVSKTPNLPFSYKSMLIQKSEQILEHIKFLKSKIVKKPKKIEQPKPIEPVGSEVKKEKRVETKSESSKPKEKKSEFQNIPEGFKEIEPSRDFKIITPHDEAYLDKLLSIHDENDMMRASPKEIPTRNEDKSFCFACGAEIPPNTRLCPQCGTKLT
jgi:ribosomal protein L40E